LENQLRAITPEQMAGSTPNFNHRSSIYWGYFTVSSQEVSTMALAISFTGLYAGFHFHFKASNKEPDNQMDMFLCPPDEETTSKICENFDSHSLCPCGIL
jgi:hypothetical protein